MGRPVSVLAFPFISSGQTSICTGLSIQQQWAGQFLCMAFPFNSSGQTSAFTWPFQSRAVGRPVPLHGLSIHQQWADQFLCMAFPLNSSGQTSAFTWPFHSTAVGRPVSVLAFHFKSSGAAQHGALAGLCLSGCMTAQLTSTYLFQLRHRAGSPSLPLLWSLSLLCNWPCRL